MEELPQNKTFDTKNQLQQTFGQNSTTERHRKEEGISNSRNYSMPATEVNQERRAINKADNSNPKTRDNS